MGENTAIAWTDHTFNPWWGCTKVSEACRNCYADAFSNRLGYSDNGTKEHSLWGPNGRRRFFGDKHWAEPLKWNRAAEKAGERRRVFCASMADVFELLPMPHRDAPAMAEARGRLWRLMRDTPALDWLLLTKRPHDANRLAEIASRDHDPWMPNIWLGTTVEDQATADERIPHLLKVPARVRFLSAEPLLEAVDLGQFLRYNPHNEQSNRDGLQGDSSGLVRGPGRWDDLESDAEAKDSQRHGDDLADRSTSNRPRQDSLSDGQIHGGREAAHGPCASANLATLQRADSARHDHQSQERSEARQPPGEPGVHHLLGEHEARLPNWPKERARGEESIRETLQRSGDGNSLRIRQRCEDAGRDSGGPRGESSGDIQGGSRGPQAKTEWPGCRLYELAKTRDEGSVREDGPIHQVIVGGESGHGARPFNLAWARSIMKQCRDTWTLVFIKQLGANPIDHPGEQYPICAKPLKLCDKKGGDMSEWPQDLRVREVPT